MKVDTAYFVENSTELDNDSRPRPSKGFVKAFRKQVVSIVKERMECFFPKDSFQLIQFGWMSFVEENDEIIGSYRGYKVMFIGYELFRFNLFWKRIDKAVKLFPYEEIDESNLLFWITDFPDDERLQYLAGNLTKDINRFEERKKEKEQEKYGFKFVVKNISEEVRLIFDTDESASIIEELFAEIVSKWNNCSPQYLIHNFYVEGTKKGKLIFVFNWGGANERTLKFVLDEINKKTLKISKITLDG